MKTKLVPFLFLAVLASPVLGQQDKPKKEVKPIPAAAKAIGMMEFSLPVTGLSAENSAKVQADLIALKGTYYECPGCGHLAAKAGECKGCKVALASKTGPVFEEVAIRDDKGLIDLHLTKAGEVRLTQIEKALKGENVQVRREKIALEPQATLVFEGGTSKDDATALQEAFRTAKHMKAIAFYQPTTKEILVRMHGSESMHGGESGWTTVVTLGSGLAKPLRLTDVIWGSMPSMEVEAS